jgi:hypothetical protein
MRDCSEMQVGEASACRRSKRHNRFIPPPPFSRSHRSPRHKGSADTLNVNDSEATSWVLRGRAFSRTGPERARNTTVVTARS